MKNRWLPWLGGRHTLGGIEFGHSPPRFLVFSEVNRYAKNGTDGVRPMPQNIHGISSLTDLDVQVPGMDAMDPLSSFQHSRQHRPALHDHLECVAG